MRLSSIFSSESPRSLRSLVILLISVLITLIVTDQIISFILPVVTKEPPSIFLLQNVKGIEKLWQYARTGNEFIAFTGSSQTFRGISPHIFADRVLNTTGQKVDAVNLGITGGLALTERDMIQNLILPNHPKILIFGVEGQAVSSSYIQNPYITGSFYDTPLGYALSIQSSIIRNIFLWLYQHSALVSYRENMRQWLAGSQVTAEGFDLANVDDFGHYQDPIIRSRDPSVILSRFTPFEATDFSRQVMRDIGQICRQSGTQCILLSTPLHEIAYQYITEADEALYQDVIHEAKLPIWNFNTKACRELLGDASFRDLNHLNEQGAQMFSKMVADAYANVFFNIPISGNAGCAVLSK